MDDKDRIMKENLLRHGTNGLVMILMMTTIVYASGVAMPYWDTNPLLMTKGESKTIQIELQNLVGESGATFQISISSTESIASLADAQETYNLNAGERTLVPIIIKLPEETERGTKYQVTVTAQESKTSIPGQFSLGSAFENSFEVIVSEPQAHQVSTQTNNITFYVIGILILVVAMVVVRRHSTKTKQSV